MKWFSLLALVGFIVAALAGNWAYFIAFLGVILVVVAIHDAVALAIGYGTAVVGGLGTRERKAMTFEVGIRNAGSGSGWCSRSSAASAAWRSWPAGGASGTSSPA